MLSFHHIADWNSDSADVATSFDMDDYICSFAACWQQLVGITSVAGVLTEGHNWQSQVAFKATIFIYLFIYIIVLETTSDSINLT